MKLSRYFLLIMLMTGVFAETYAQQLKENEIVVIQGEKFVLHHVRTGETVFSISRHYKIDSQVLEQHNPRIVEGLKIGDTLKIPYSDSVGLPEFPQSKKGDPERFEYYTITSRTETPYFIAREFGITVEEIYAYNPEVFRFKKGSKIRIPVWEQEGKPVTAQPAVEPAQTSEEHPVLRAHELKAGETLTSLARHYKVSESEILFYNPGARDLKTGSVVYIPVKEGSDFRSPSDKIANSIDESLTATYLEPGNSFEHHVVSGETLWSITRKYNVTEEELKALNPVLESGFPAGAVLKIPVKHSELTPAEPVNEEAFLRHEVQSGETLFRLASQYGLTIPEIRKFNPQLENRNLVQGETVLIPRLPAEKTAQAEPDETSKPTGARTPLESGYYAIESAIEIPENCHPRRDVFSPQTVYDVALFLPFFARANDELNPGIERFVTDSVLAVQDTIVDDIIIEEDRPSGAFHGFFRESENFVQFYEGVLLAVDSLQDAGMKVRLNVFDTQQNPDSIRKFIYADGFLETDLIIGPVYPQVQGEVAAIAAKNRIPVVSPLAAQSRDITSNPYYYQINPTREFLAAKTADLITEEYFNSNFIVIKTNNSGGIYEGKVVDMVREKLQHSGFWQLPEGMSFHEYDFSTERASGFGRVLSPDKENVILVSSMNEGDLSLILSNINNLVGDFSITLVGFNRYEQFESISEEFFHRLRLQYVAPYWTDYSDPATIRFLEKFKAYFHMEPDNFGKQGYDVAFYFLNALHHYGKDFEECLPYQQVHLSQGNYSFEKVSQFGGYMNHGVSVISYEPDFEVVRKRVIGPFRFAEK